MKSDIRTLYNQIHEDLFNMLVLLEEKQPNDVKFISEKLQAVRRITNDIVYRLE
jgi:ABC-type oligopeptide transport system ATPase subunit